MAAEERRAGEQAEAQWRATFEPHAIILTERRIPRPMFLAAVIGVERLLRIDFNANAKPVSFVSLAVEGVKQKRAQWGSNGGALPGYGAPTGIIVNYAPDWAVKFDLAGVPQEAFAAAYRVGQVQLLLKGRPNSRRSFAASRQWFNFMTGRSGDFGLSPSNLGFMF